MKWSELQNVSAGSRRKRRKQKKQRAEAHCRADGHWLTLIAS